MAIDNPYNTIKTRRLPSLDILRGLFILIILVNHLALYPNILMFLSGRSQLWMSAAEGFMVISGFLVGYIYLKKYKQSPLTTTMRLLKRSLIIYIATILLGIFCMAFALISPLISNTDLNFLVRIEEEGLVKFIIDVLTLNFSYQWSEFLSHYVIFMLLSPLALLLIRRNMSLLLLSMSIAVWYFSLSITPSDSVFVRSSWQLLFFSGIIIGAYYTTISNFLISKLEQKTLQALKITLWCLSIILIIVSTYLTWGYTSLNNYIHLSDTPLGSFSNWWWSIGAAEGAWLSKSNLGILRILSGVVVFWALFTFVNSYHTTINHFTKNIFEEIGKRSLLAYSIHAVIVVCLLFVTGYLNLPTTSFIWNSLLTGLAMILLYISIKYIPLSTTNAIDSGRQTSNLK